MKDASWEAIFDKYQIHKHNFDEKPFFLSGEQIKQATSQFGKTGEKEVRILCYQDSRESRPKIFVENELFVLSIKNRPFKCAIVKGEGYIDIPKISSNVKIYTSRLDFKLDTSFIGNSEMQHLDFAYASSLVRTFLEDETLVLTIRGKKYTTPFSFKVGNQDLTVESVQTEVDGGYEGKNQVVLIEAKNSKTPNTIIRQLYYPFRQWSQKTKKKVRILFFEKREKYYSFWQFEFKDINDYNSIHLTRSCRYEIIEK
ncbi:MAG: hypothetical protein KGZ58_12500 [Ignavibacteriales bacterium]|nr:hypothetical protein [Ignavibacteriales bacterium]